MNRPYHFGQLALAYGVQNFDGLLQLLHDRVGLRTEGQGLLDERLERSFDFGLVTLAVLASAFLHQRHLGQRTCWSVTIHRP